MRPSAVSREFARRLDAALEQDAGDAPGVSGPYVNDAAPGAAPVSQRVSLHRAAAECPAGALVEDPRRFDAEGDFVEAVFTCTREVALNALRRNPPGRPAEEIVQEAMADPESLRWGVADWVARADRAARSVLHDSAVSWVIDARALAARRGEPQWQPPAALSHRPRGCDVTLTATVDARRTTGSGAHLLVLRPRRDSAERRLVGRVALLWALGRGEVAASVVLGVRESLERRQSLVEDSLLEEAIDDAVADIGRTQRPSLAPRIPGAECRYCGALSECEQGRAHVAASRRYPCPPSDPASPA